MLATDFNLPQEISFSQETGITSFRNTRLLLFDADAIGLLRQNLIGELGITCARDFFLKFGYQNGYADFMQMKINYQFDTEMELFSAGPVLFNWEGLAHTRPTEVTFNKERGEFYFRGVWTNSYEAEQHLSHNQPSAEPVCWSLTGYASGWSSAFFGSPLVAMESACVGKGDSFCECVVKTPQAWGEAAAPYLAAFQQLGKRG